MKNLIIVGAGGFGREVLSWARGSPDHGRVWTIGGFLDDNPDALRGIEAGCGVLGSLRDWQPRNDDVFLCAIGRPGIRRSTHEALSGRGGRFASLVHPAAIVAERSRLGDGAIVCPFALVSVDARVGEGAAIYYHSSVDHDAVVGPWCQISAHCDVTGGAVLGAEVFLGSHATVLPGVRIGDRAIVAAGAVVTEDVPPGVTVAGVPARRIRQ